MAPPISKRSNRSEPGNPEKTKQEEMRGRKRRAEDDGERFSKKRRSWSLSDSSSSHQSGLTVEEKPSLSSKRKGSDHSEEPLKKRRCRKRFCITESSTSGCSSGSSSRESHSSDSSGDDVDSSIAMEEKIFEMSTSGNGSRADFEGKYISFSRIGAGGFGTVYAGVRNVDLLPVAIKHIDIDEVHWEQVIYNGKEYCVILEVALMLKAAGLPGSGGNSAAVSLLDWYLLEHELILVMERPRMCKDLERYFTLIGFLEEDEAKTILSQLVDAAIYLHSKGIFHRDIKFQNVLVEYKEGSLDTIVRIIDFGCGSFEKEGVYHSFSGTRAYAPPEWLEERRYRARPTTVWQLGALFYELLQGHHGFDTMDYVHNTFQINEALSTESKTLLHMCLSRDPAKRATLEDLQLYLRDTCPSPN